MLSWLRHGREQPPRPDRRHRDHPGRRRAPHQDRGPEERGGGRRRGPLDQGRRQEDGRRAGGRPGPQCRAGERGQGGPGAARRLRGLQGLPRQQGDPGPRRARHQRRGAVGGDPAVDDRRPVPVLRGLREGGARLAARPGRGPGTSRRADRGAAGSRRRPGPGGARQDQGGGPHRLRPLRRDHRDHAGHGGHRAVRTAGRRADRRRGPDDGGRVRRGRRHRQARRPGPLPEPGRRRGAPFASQAPPGGRDSRRRALLDAPALHRRHRCHVPGRRRDPGARHPAPAPPRGGPHRWRRRDGGPGLDAGQHPGGCGRRGPGAGGCRGRPAAVGPQGSAGGRLSGAGGRR